MARASDFDTLRFVSHLYCETPFKLAPDIQGSRPQVFISIVCRSVSGDCGYTKQPEQSDESSDTRLQPRVW